MNVLTITSSYPKYPGDVTSPFIESITEALAERGHTQDVVLPHHPELRRPPGRVRFYPYRYVPFDARGGWGYAESLASDVRVKPRTYALVPLAALGLRRTVAERLRARRYDALHVHWLVPNAALVFDLARAHALPLVISLHGSDVFLAERSLPARLLAGGALRQAGAVSACSSDLRSRALALGAPPRRTRTVPYGVDATAFSPGASGAGVRERFGIPANAFLVLGVGRLVEKKGFRVLIDAAAMLPGAHVLLAGDGSLREELRRHAEALRAPVTFAGALGRDLMPGAFAAADVVAVPSVVDRSGNVDGLPNALLEALAAGRPIVASAVAGIPDVVSDGRNGLLVKAGDAAALAAALRRLKDDAEARGALAAAARRSAERELTWARAAQAFEELFAEASSLDAR
jgi:glycosyltransferase involved in cell wall biosynthesis